jgi:hypothetical protein
MRENGNKVVGCRVAATLAVVNSPQAERAMGFQRNASLYQDLRRQTRATMWPKRTAGTDSVRFAARTAGA